MTFGRPLATQRGPILSFFDEILFPMRQALSRRALALAFCFPLICGCGNGLYEASGRLTYKGQPIPSTYVYFKPEEEGKRFSTGLTDDAGNFKLRFSTTENGVYPGKHTVYLQYYVDVDEELGRIKPKVPSDLKKLMANKYGTPDVSPLKYEISKGGQVIEINIE